MASPWYAKLHGDFWIHQLKHFSTRRAWTADESHACRNLSGTWVDAAPGLAASYASSALAAGDMLYDAGLNRLTNPFNWRTSKPWTWQRNETAAPKLLVYHDAEDNHQLPTADAIDWADAMRGRVVLFVGDSLANYQAFSLLFLVSDQKTTSIESCERVARSKAFGSGENIHQMSWCRAVCAKVHGKMSRKNRCREVHTVVCWLSAGKSESPTMLRRTLALVTTWVFSSLSTLTTHDVIVGSYGHHFFPRYSERRMLARQLEAFVEVCRWHADGRWRMGVDANDEAAATDGGPWTRRVPHTLYREANPQFWPGGVFPGRVGTSSRKHDCLPPWDYKTVQRPYSGRRDEPPGSPEGALEQLLGPRAFAAYNADGCDAVARSPVSLLRAWLPSALLGSRESSIAGDYTHSFLPSSTHAFWNQLLLHAVWRRERRWDPDDTDRGGTGRNRPSPDRAARQAVNRLETWRELQQMLALSDGAHSAGGGRDSARDGSYGAICGKRGRANGTAYRPYPLACCTELSPVQKCGHMTHAAFAGVSPSALHNDHGTVILRRKESKS